ncbi:MAG: 5'/3'-nucleotidase SurE [Acidobacteria bacterium]|nr:MAG: 5'/3'-nucleotidase SurE [Acidobacteriota bacterium]
MGQKRILITNDDGIQAQGLKAAEASLAAVGEVLVVAPEREMSATSQAISIHFPLRVRVLDERHYAVSGTPADSVILALHQLLKARPDLVVSGINQGANLGENVIYSGTVAGALEATLHGVPAIAMSLASRQNQDFSAAAAFAAQLAAKVLAEGLPSGVMLNVNVPRGEVRGVRITRQSRKITQNVIHEKKDPRGRPYYWQDETVAWDNVEPDSDYAAIRAHEISITPLQVDRTDYPSLNHLSHWLASLRASPAGNDEG